MSDRVTAWHEAYADDIYAFVRSRGLPLEDAEDVCSQVFLEATRCADSLTDDPRGWFYKVARCRIVDWRRRQKHRMSVCIEDCNPVSPGIESAVLDRIDLEQCWLALNSDRQRIAAWMYFVEDQSIEDVALCLNTTQVAVKALIHRARVCLSQSRGSNSAPI